MTAKPLGRILLPAILMAAMLSCDKVSPDPEQPQKPAEEEVEVPLLPIKVTAMAHTLWTGSETIAVSMNCAPAVQSDSMEVCSESTSAIFHASIDTAGAVAPYRFDVFYPAVSVAGTNADGSFDLVVPSVQEAGAVGFDASCDILHASAEFAEGSVPSAVSVVFEPVLAYGTVEVAGLDDDERIVSVTVSSEDVALAGKVRLHVSGANAGAVEAAGESHSIEVRAAGATKVAFACLPCANSGNLTVTVVTDRASVTKTLSPREFAKGRTSSMSVRLKTVVNPDAMLFTRALAIAPGDVIAFVSNAGNQWYACGVPNTDNSLMAIPVDAPDDGVLGIMPNGNLDTFVVGGGAKGDDWTFTSQKKGAAISWSQNLYKASYDTSRNPYHTLALLDVYEMRYKVMYTSSPARMIQFSPSTNQMNNGQPCFVYGAGAQTDVFIYRKAESVGPEVDLYGQAYDITTESASVRAAYQFDVPSSVGFEYSVDGQTWTVIPSTAVEKNGIGVFEETIDGLEPGTLCSYRAFMYVDGVRYESRTSSFTTSTGTSFTYAWIQPDIEYIWPETHLEEGVGDLPTDWTVDITYPNGAPTNHPNALYESRGFQIGTQANPADRIVFTNTALKDKTIKSISFVGCVGNECTDPSISITVGGAQQKINGSAVAGPAVLIAGGANEYVCKPGTSGEIVVTLSRSGTGRAMYFKSLTVVTE